MDREDVAEEDEKNANSSLRLRQMEWHEGVRPQILRDNPSWLLLYERVFLEILLWRF